MMADGRLAVVTVAAGIFGREDDFEMRNTVHHSVGNTGL